MYLKACSHLVALLGEVMEPLEVEPSQGVGGGVCHWYVTGGRALRFYNLVLLPVLPLYLLTTRLSTCLVSYLPHHDRRSP